MKIMLMTFLFLGLNSHDIQIAYFKIHQQESNLAIDFVFEHDNILSIWEDSDAQLTDKMLQEYISSNFSLSVNGNLQNIVYGNMLIKNKHIYLTGNIPDMTRAINTLEIKNSCLLDIEDHSNIIEISLNEKQRDFLMNKGRTSILVTY